MPSRLAVRRPRRFSRFGFSVVVGSLLAGSFVCAGPIAADEEAEFEPIYEHDRLTGSWFGARDALDRMGLVFEAYYTLELAGNVSGGLRRDLAVLGDLDLLLMAELEPLLGWRGARVFLYGLGLHGDDPSLIVGDIQGVSNIGATPTWKLFEAWFEQELFDGRFSLLAGLYDVNSEFDVIPAASLFAHSSPGMGADFGLSGLNGPSTFPTTSLGARVQVRPTEALYVRVVVSDGVSGDPNDPGGVQIQFDAGDGALIVAEVGFYNLPTPEARGRTRRQGELLPPEERHYGHFGKFAIGAWGYTGDMPDLGWVGPGGEALVTAGSYGLYALAEQRVYYEPDDPFQGLSLFLRVGFADERTSVVDGYVGGGAVYRGLIPGRDRDRTGLSVAAAHLGGAYRSAPGLGGVRLEEWEVAIELTHRARLFPGISVQPNFQVVFDPGGAPAVSDAVLVGVRVILEL